jgi:hypothetical protein
MGQSAIRLPHLIIRMMFNSDIDTQSQSKRDFYVSMNLIDFGNIIE